MAVTSRGWYRLVVLAGLVAGACTHYTIREEREALGFNGSFEITSGRLPINWYFYYPPIRRGQADVSIDTARAVDGKQSVMIVARETDPDGGWRSAGMFQVAPAEPLTTYRVSYWLRNQDATIRVGVVSEQPMESPPPEERILTPQETGAANWQKFETRYTVPAGYDNIRFELNVLEPGTVWIDQVRIEPEVVEAKADSSPTTAPQEPGQE